MQFASTDVGGCETEIQQAKEVVRKIDARAPSKMTIEAGAYLIWSVVC